MHATHFSTLSTIAMAIDQCYIVFATHNRRNAAMPKLVEKAPVDKDLPTILEIFYTTFDMGHMMHRVVIDKEQDVHDKSVLFALLSIVLMRIHLSEAISKAMDSFGFGKILFVVSRTMQKQIGRTSFFMCPRSLYSSSFR